MKIILLSPKGPLYRHRGGIFKKNLRYAPLTLTTLASLVPRDLDASVEILDEGIEDIDIDRLQADLVGITTTTGNSIRAYELADRLRSHEQEGEKTQEIGGHRPEGTWNGPLNSASQHFVLTAALFSLLPCGIGPVSGEKHDVR